MTIEVLEPGALTTVQDPVGRRGWRHLGVPMGGAADRWSARLANRLVGNAEADAGIEFTLSGPVLQFEMPSTVALVGRFDAAVDGLPLAPARARALRAGSVVRIASGVDARGYLAIAGGIDLPRVLGSASTDLRTGFGGLDGRALDVGDRLPIGRPAGGAARWTGASAEGPIRIVPGPHVDRLAGTRALTAAHWEIGTDADRTGVRLDGPRIDALGPEIDSMGVPEGAVQVPPDGRPIVMLSDRPVTGGYPVPWVVVAADVGRLARLRPGTEVRFVEVTFDEARAAWADAERQLTATEPLDAGEGDVPGSWAGSHV